MLKTYYFKLIRNSIMTKKEEKLNNSLTLRVEKYRKGNEVDHG